MRRILHFERLTLAALLLLTAVANGQKKEKGKHAEMRAAAIPMIWESRGPVTADEMTYGNGSKPEAPTPFPDGTFHFVREEIMSTFPKVEVKDSLGHKFKVKFGMGADSKSHSEVVSNRLLWAMGFRARHIYYVPSGMLDTFKAGDPKHPSKHSKMGGHLVKDANGRYHFSDVTFTEKEDDELAEKPWGYEDSSLPASITKSPQFTWLKIFDVMVGNWDTASKNHAIYYVKNSAGAIEAWYADKDVGTGYGNVHSGSGLVRKRPTRWKLGDYQKASFVIWDRGHPNTEVSGGVIHFDFGVSPSMVHGQQVLDACSTVSKADAKAFVEQVLNKIPEAAIREAFRTAGATQPEIDGFTTAVLNRIQELRVASGATG
jgi:hypothetical protein